MTNSWTDHNGLTSTRLCAPWAGLGFGDAIGNARIVPYIAQEAPADTVLAVQPELVRLFSQLGFPVVSLPDVNPADYPGGFYGGYSGGMHFDKMPLPPLWADTRIVLPRTPGRLLAGLCWQGSGGGRSAVGLDDDPRCIQVEHLLPLLQKAGVDWVALQMADRTPELRALPGFENVAGLDTYGVSDFADTAGILKQLDLVITVDTSIVHLAGSLGRKTWLLLRHEKHPIFDHGRWSIVPPLYPTVRQFRQTIGNDVRELIARVGTELDVTIKEQQVAT